MGTPWTVESYVIVLKMAPDFTSRQIADALCEIGVKKTRNAVLGYMHRKGIPSGRPSTRTTSLANMAVRKERNRKKKKILSNKEMKKPDMQYLKHPEFHRETGRTLESLCEHECRWPVTDTKPFLFCGEKSLDGKSYCELHQKLSYKKPNPNYNAACRTTTT